ncbi:hypothetical protein AVEN_164867-1 [Araneus ventricosus]|uniref:Uncharacterized protein n=1 Tax=Araneus ventricosus TaxID=182803 RepID=A0A4Y2Q282_ARAVE|nr:hypothetical protein AVEN_197231-1 [Araneus ventricosus]GBN57514.1 hypothetical protein AVEN_164867-1 [Araneus ventricosus]
MGRPISRKKRLFAKWIGLPDLLAIRHIWDAFGRIETVHPRKRSLWHRRCDGLVKCHIGRTRHLRIFGRDFVTSVRHRSSTSTFSRRVLESEIFIR